MTTKKRPYVGVRKPYPIQNDGFCSGSYIPEDSDEILRELLSEDKKPTTTSHPQYKKIIGPFKTVKGAAMMKKHGPHVLATVAAAERLAKDEANG